MLTVANYVVDIDRYQCVSSISEPYRQCQKSSDLRLKADMMS